MDTHTIKRLKDCKTQCLRILVRNDEECVKKGETSIWFAGITDGSFPQFFKNGDDLLDYIFRLSEDDNIIIFSYELRDEWCAIEPLLQKRGFVEVAKVDRHARVYSVSSDINRTDILCAEVHGPYDGHRIVFSNLSRKFPANIEALAHSVGLTIDENEADPAITGNTNYIVGDRERNYMRNHLNVLTTIIEKFNDDDLFFSKATIGSYAIKKGMDETYARAIQASAKFRESYPRFKIVEDAQELYFQYNAYGGGLTDCNNELRGKLVNGKILHIDEHQAYPSTTIDPKNAFPCGRGEYFKETPPKGKLCVLHIKATFAECTFNPNTHVDLQFARNVDFYMWDFELPSYIRAYGSFEYKIIDGYAYDIKPFPLKKYFMSNYDKRIAAENAGNWFDALVCKFLNNTSYGKFAEKPFGAQLYYNMGLDAFTAECLAHSDKPYYGGPFTYPPLASCMSAYARVKLLDTAYEFGIENVLYMATDSLFVLLNEKTQKVWDSMNHANYLGG